MYLLQDLTKCGRQAFRWMSYHVFSLLPCPWTGRSETVPGLHSTEPYNSEQTFTTQQYKKRNGNAIVSSVSSNASFRKAVWEQITLIEPLGRSNCDLKFCFFLSCKWQKFGLFLYECHLVKPTRLLINPV